jgi:ankyrin repeat protein
LYIAAQKDHLAMVQCLVEEPGADVNQAMKDGGKPLHIAADRGYFAFYGTETRRKT